MNFFNIRAIAQYEMKLLLRTARFWILCGIGFISAAVMTAFVILFNIFGSGDVSLGGLFAVNTLPYYSLLYFNIVINITMIFFVFNFKSKDDFSYVTDVLQSKPLTSFEIIIGKYLGVIVPIIIVGLFIMVISLIMGLIFLDVPVKFENHTYYFLIINIPSILFISAFEFFIVLAVKNRFAVISLSLGYVGVIWLWLSNYFYSLFDFGAYQLTIYTSDLIGFANVDDIILQRILYLILGFVFISLSILFYPRLRQAKREYIILKMLLILMVLVSSAIVYYFPYRAEKREEYRKTALEAEKKYINYNAPWIKHYAMKINLLPKERAIEVSANIKILNNTGEKLNNLIFSLNPGLKINHCLMQKGSKQKSVNFIKDYSILNVDISEIPVFPDDSANVVIEYKGTLDDRAFFLEFDESKKRGVSDIIIQELTGAIYYWIGKDYSFLLPETGWYPTGGPSFGYQYPEKRRVCFSTADISIRVPEGHTTLTQGELVSVINNKKESVFNWVSDIPVPKFSINTGKYETVSTLIDTIKCTLYYSPLHKKNISFFSDVSDTLKGFIAKKLREIRDRTGLNYPYKSLSLIEVPLQIAEFSKSWDRPGVMNQPGISMMKEGGILIANFKRTFDSRIKRAKKRGDDTSKENIKLNVLDRYISRSGMFESRIDHKFIPNYWGLRFDPEGKLYPLLTFGMNNFVTEWITGAVPVPPIRAKSLRGGFGMRVTGDGASFSGNLRFSAGIDSVYKLLEEKPLIEFSPADDPDLFRQVMNVKGEAMVKTLRELMGKEKFGELLKTFVLRYSYRYPTINIFKETAEEIYKGNLDDFFNNWLNVTQVPGFRLKGVEAYQIESEIPSYQIIVRLKNQELGEGYVKLTFKTEKDVITKFLNFKSYEGKEIKIVVPDKPSYVDVEPFFSLNRESFRENFYISENKKLRKGEESYKTISILLESAGDEIIVDNLDDNFYVMDLSEKTLLRPDSDKSKKNEFKPLPRNLSRRDPNTWGSLKKWRLRYNKYAYGKYRHTSLVKNKGSGKKIAVWKAYITEPDEYMVYFYINDNELKNRKGRLKLGRAYNITIYHKDGKEEINFNARGSENGWNELGSYYFSKGDYKVELSDKSDGLILADAVKWVKK